MKKLLILLPLLFLLSADTATKECYKVTKVSSQVEAPEMKKEKCWVFKYILLGKWQCDIPVNIHSEGESVSIMILKFVLRLKSSTPGYGKGSEVIWWFDPISMKARYAVW